MSWLWLLIGMLGLWVFVLWLWPDKHRDANDPNVRSDDFKWAQWGG